MKYIVEVVLMTRSYLLSNKMYVNDKNVNNNYQYYGIEANTTNKLIMDYNII